MWHNQKKIYDLFVQITFLSMTPCQLLFVSHFLRLGVFNIYGYLTSETVKAKLSTIFRIIMLIYLKGFVRFLNSESIL